MAVGDIEKVICCSEALLMAQFTEYNLLRAVINSKGEMDDVYFARSFISLQNRVLRQVGIDRMTDALRDEQALLPRASKFLK